MKLTKKGLPDKRGKSPNTGKAPKKGKGVGRKKLYKGERVSIMFYTTETLAQRVKAEAQRQSTTRNRLFNRWLEDLPPAPGEEQE